MLEVEQEWVVSGPSEVSRVPCSGSKEGICSSYVGVRRMKPLGNLVRMLALLLLLVIID